MNKILTFLYETKKFIVVVLWFSLSSILVIYGPAIYNIIVDIFVENSSVPVFQDQWTVHNIAIDSTQVSEKSEIGTFYSIRFSLENLLSYRTNTQSLSFNTLPPGHRVIIPSLWIKAPIVDVAYADHEKLQKWDFKDELESWVVRYPYTSIPGVETAGNSVLFWHSSVELRDKGKYGYIFQKLPKVNIWEDISVVRDGILYNYEIDHKVIKWPKDVSQELASRNDKSYLTLMACYPLFSDAQRILVRAKLVLSKDQTLTATQSPKNTNKL